MKLIKRSTGFRISYFVYYEYCIIQIDSAHSTVLEINTILQQNLMWVTLWNFQEGRK